MDAPPPFAELREALESIANPADAAPMASYMKDRFVFLGIKSPPRREAQREHVAAGKFMSPAEIIDFADECWAQPEREFQYIGADFLRRWVKVLDAGHIADLERFISTKSWWDTVDNLATNVVGPLVQQFPELREVMDEFIDDPDFWIARTAILHQLKYKTGVDTDRLFSYAAKRAGDTEFFIRKAIGWALRQHSRVDPASVKKFVADHEHTLSGLSKREALRLM